MRTMSVANWQRVKKKPAYLIRQGGEERSGSEPWLAKMIITMPYHEYQAGNGWNESKSFITRNKRERVWLEKKEDLISSMTKVPIQKNK